MRHIEKMRKIADSIGVEGLPSTNGQALNALVDFTDGKKAVIFDHCAICEIESTGYNATVNSSTQSLTSDTFADFFELFSSLDDGETGSYSIKYECADWEAYMNTDALVESITTSKSAISLSLHGKTSRTVTIKITVCWSVVKNK